MRDYPRVYFACHRRHVRDEVSGRVLSSHQASVLDHLDAVEPTFVSRLAGHMGVTSSTMSLTLDRLEAGGFVSRSSDEADQRRVCVRLTAAGERIKRASSVLDPELLEALLGTLPETDRVRAVEGLALLALAAKRLGSSGKGSTEWEARRDGSSTTESMGSGGKRVKGSKENSDP